MRKRKIKREHFVTIFLLSFKKKSQNLEENLENLSPHFFTLILVWYLPIAFWKLVLRKFRQVLKIGRHLMLNPSWDASH
jgi:hypothetical protein